MGVRLKRTLYYQSAAFGPKTKAHREREREMGEGIIGSESELLLMPCKKDNCYQTPNIITPPSPSLPPSASGNNGFLSEVELGEDPTS